jgi:hypothetical protein
MRQYIDLKMIKRWNNISKVLIFLGLGLLIGALVMTFRQPQLNNQFLILSFIGVICSQVGLSLNNRWGASPRIDEILDEALKGLDNRYRIFHYKLGTNHALFSPAGAFALVPRFEDGEITYDGDKWFTLRTKRRMLRRSGKRKLGDVQKNAEAEARAMHRALQRVLSDDLEISVHPILVFVNDDTYVKIDDAPLQVVHAKKLKSLIRSLPKAKSLTTKELDLLAEKKGF